MVEVILHIGLHKTATTTLQRQLFSSCQQLNYLSRNGAVGAFVQSAAVIDPIYYDASGIRSQLMPHFRDDAPNLISSESLSGPLYAGVGKAGLDHRSPILENLRETLPEARIVLVIRRQDALASSLYRQYIRSGGTESVRTFYGISGGKSAIFPLNRFRFARYIDRLQVSFPRGVLVLTFEEFAKDRKQFLNRLGEFVGVEFPVKQLQSSNQTRLGATGMEFTRLCNRLFRSRLYPGGILPGIPRYRSGKLVWVNPTWALHGAWPFRPKNVKGGELFLVGKEILASVREDNKELDQKYALGLAGYEYY